MCISVSGAYVRSHSWLLRCVSLYIIMQLKKCTWCLSDGRDCLKFIVSGPKLGWWKNKNRKNKNKCVTLFTPICHSLLMWWLQYWSTVLQVKTKEYFSHFTVIDESKLDKMIDFSSETEVCTRAKYQRTDCCIIKESLWISVSFYGKFSGAKVSTGHEFLRL